MRTLGGSREVPHKFVDPSQPGVGTFRLFDARHVTPLEAKRQAVKSDSGLGRSVQREGQVNGLGHVPRFGIGQNADLNDFSFLIAAALRLAALIPIRHCPRIRAMRLRHVCPLMVIMMAGLASGPSDLATCSGTSTPFALPERMTRALKFMLTSLSSKN